MVYLLKMVIFHGELLNNQRVHKTLSFQHLPSPGCYPGTAELLRDGRRLSSEVGTRTGVFRWEDSHGFFMETSMVSWKNMEKHMVNDSECFFEDTIPRFTG